ncbi:MAG: nucleoside kinase [Candidatus Promineifilaceae bacterium]|jgi:uridine kinase
MNKIVKAERRQTVQARFESGSTFEGPIGTPVEQFIMAANPPVDGQIVAALINGRLRELSHELMIDADIVPITTADSDGSRIYRRSLTFLVIAAAAEVFPGRTITVQHSMPFGGYYCERDDEQQLTDEELAALERRMRELVRQDLPIKQVRVPLDEALEQFRAQDDLEKVELFSRRRKDYLTMYEINGVRDYFHGFMVPRTGFLDLFALHHYGDGFIFQFPRRQWPHALQPFEDEPRLATVFRDYQDWLSIMGVASVTGLNREINSGRTGDVILVAEALHQRQLASIAAEIASRQPHVRFVMISGPTSAGKTTFSKRLAIQLLANGIFPVTIGMDDYFVNREETPRDEHGEFDFEALEAIDLALFRKHLRRLSNGDTIICPKFNFHTGQREWGDELAIGPKQVIIVEGIHGLNPALVEGVPEEAVYGIFVSAFTQLNIDKHNRVPTTDTRLLRRIVRDAAYRGYTATDTLRRWPSVRRGEKQYIFPNQNNADRFFNSALVYEMSVLKRMAQPLLLQVEPGTPQRVEANRLLAFLQWFEPIPPADQEMIAGDSIIREFIGGSILEDYEPWNR